MSSGEGGLRCQNRRWGSKGQSPVLSDYTAPNVVFSVKIGTSVQIWNTLRRRFIYLLKLSSEIKHLSVQILKTKVQGKCDQISSCLVMPDTWNSPEFLFPSSPFVGILWRQKEGMDSELDLPMSLEHNPNKHFGGSHCQKTGKICFILYIKSFYSDFSSVNPTPQTVWPRNIHLLFPGAVIPADSLILKIHSVGQCFLASFNWITWRMFSGKEKHKPSLQCSHNCLHLQAT